MRIGRFTAIVAAVAAVAGWSSSAVADAAAGKAKFAADCAECHEAADFQGEDVKALTDSLKKISAGTMKHKQALKLTDQEAADLAAYMSAGK